MLAVAIFLWLIRDSFVAEPPFVEPLPPEGSVMDRRELLDSLLAGEDRAPPPPPRLALEVPVAGAVFFHFGKTAIYKFGASHKAFQHLRANNLVMWEAIKWHARRGLGMLDFGRTSLENEGLRRFKLGWGTQERLIDYFRYDQRKAGFVTARDESAGWHNRIFRMLPVPLSRLIGATFYRHVA